MPLLGSYNRHIKRTAAVHISTAAHHGPDHAHTLRLEVLKSTLEPSLELQAPLRVHAAVTIATYANRP